MNRIKTLREERAWKQEDLAKKLGLQKSAISKYESEKVALSAETIKKLCEIFSVSSDYLLCITDIRTKKDRPNEERSFSDDYMRLKEITSTLSDEEIRKTQDYVNFLISQRT